MMGELWVVGGFFFNQKGNTPKRLYAEKEYT
jgi:hypothetical protein